MEESIEGEYFDEYDNSSERYAWWSLPSFIEWLKEARHKDSSEKRPINLTIILHSATLIEGFICQLLIEECGTPVYKKTMEDRLLIDLNKRFETASWGNYQELFELIIGKKIVAFTTTANWKSITMLFQLRNLLTHGKSIELKFYTQNQKEPVIGGKYQTIYKYFKEIKLIDVNSADFLPGTVDLVTSKSADFFYNECIVLIDQLYIKIGKSDKYNKPIADAYELVFEK